MPKTFRHLIATVISTAISLGRLAPNHAHSRPSGGVWLVIETMQRSPSNGSGKFHRTTGESVLMKSLSKVATIIAGCLLITASSHLPQLLAQTSQPEIANPLKNTKDGLTVNKPTAFQGYSLVAPMNSTSTYLIDMDGRIVNEWKSEFTPALSAYLLENGNLLRPGAERGFMQGGPGAGGRIQEFTWEGELVWDYSFGDSKLGPHHDICRLPNGNVLIVANDPKTKEEAIAAGRRPESVRSRLLPDCILEIKPTGKTTGEIVWHWHAWDHLIQDSDKKKSNYGDVSEHPELVDLNFSTGMIDRMMNDPQQLAKLRSLGYVGSSPPLGAKPGEVPGNKTPKKEDAPKDQPGEPGSSTGKPGQGGPNPRGPAGGPGPGFGGPPMGPMEGDWMHVNSVTYNPKLDQIMISVHEFSEVWIIDHSTTTAEAASHKGGGSGHGGDLLYRWGNPRVYRSGSNVDQQLFAQHSAHWIAEGIPGAGHMLVFNNGSGRPDGAYSTVDEVPLPMTDKGLYSKEDDLAYAPAKAVWSYIAPDKTSFNSMLISGAQRLPNGNTFVCSGNQGLLFEVTPKNEIVWQFKYPGAGFGGPGGPGGMGPGGPGGPGFGPPRVEPGEVMPEFLQAMFGVSGEQKESLAKLKGELKPQLVKLLTAEQLQILDAPKSSPFNLGSKRTPRFGDVIPSFVFDELALSDVQQAELKKIQKGADKQLEKIWTDDQKTRFKEMESMFARGPGGGPPGGGFGPPPGGGPPAGGPPGPRGGGFGPPGGGPGGPGGPGGIFRCYRYGTEYAGLAGKELKPGKKLDEVAVAPQRRPVARPPAEE